MNLFPSPDRYDSMAYNRCGRSGLLLPAVSLGLWHNFGGVDTYENARAMVRRAFDLGVTHFDLANNYGPPPGSAEETFGRILKQDLAGYRDELIISSKAGYRMWPGPYGEWGSRKYLLASLDQSLKRMGLDYVDIFYSHRFDPETPVEETMMALDQAVRQGKALYAGISSYGPEQTRRAAQILRELGTPCTIHQPSYNMFDRWIEDGLTDVLEEEGIGCIVYVPLAQGLLTGKFGKGHRFAKGDHRKRNRLFRSEHAKRVHRALDELRPIAEGRGITLGQLALGWVIAQPGTCAIAGARNAEQVLENARAAEVRLSPSELAELDRIGRRVTDHLDDNPVLWHF